VPTGGINVRILFLSDTHLGFDLPFKPRVQRRRRGPDFFEMFEKALEPAFRGEVDAVIHGGDILFRSKVPPQLVQMAFEPLQRLADKGVPIYIVPGNHERSKIPYRLLASHPNIHIFVRPKTFYLELKGFTLAIAGFPYVRDNVRRNFLNVLAETQWHSKPHDAALLCIHHCVEGSAIKQGNKMYFFRYNPDVIKIAELQQPFAAVLSGHIHRFQVLNQDLMGNPMAVPVIYPGSTERTSFIEKDEAKGYIIMELEKGCDGFPGGTLKHWQFFPLPNRPMIQLAVKVEGMKCMQLKEWLQHNIRQLPVDAVVQVRIRGNLSADCLSLVKASSLRALAPVTMSISLSIRNMQALGLN
jgi:DNA repair protein SbcD/Mre11